MTSTEFLNTLVKICTSMMFVMSIPMVIKALCSIFIELNKEKDIEKAVAKSIEEKKEKRDRTINQYLEQNETLKGLGFNSKLEICIYCPYKNNVWIETFSIDIENSSVTVTDQKNRTYACSIDNIKIIRSVDLDTEEKIEENLSGYNPKDEFWSPKDNEKIEVGENEDWCDF